MHDAPLPADPSPQADRRRELTLRAVLTAIVVAALIGASYPYVVLKIGYGPNISVVSAFFGYMALSAIGFVTGARTTRFETNLVQTAGTAAGQAGFMCVVLAAFDMLNAKPELGFSVHLSSMQIFLWLSVAGLIGVLLAVPLRKHYIDEENLTFADGTAAGETLLVLDQGPKEAGPRVAALGIGMGLSGFIAFLRDRPFKLLPEYLGFGAHGDALRMGTEVSLASAAACWSACASAADGSGMLLGVIAPPPCSRTMCPRRPSGGALSWAGHRHPVATAHGAVSQMEGGRASFERGARNVDGGDSRCATSSAA